MKFRAWLETTITHNTAKTLVLNAIGVAETDPKQQSELLGSPIGQHKGLEDKLAAFRELRSHASEISGYIHGNKKRTLQDLIKFVAELDNQKEKPTPTTTPVQPLSVGPGGLAPATSPEEEPVF
jgi:hypothetical protein